MYSFDRDTKHALHVAHLACNIFAQTGKLHKLSKDYGLYLKWASMLHDIGLAVDIKKHHKHTYNLIMQYQFNFLDSDEKELVAAIARYHRKAKPKVTHKAVANLGERRVEVVRRLAAILRVADGLDRSHMQSVVSTSINSISPVVELSLIGSNIADIDVFGGKKKSDLFKHVFIKDIILVRG